MHVRNVGLINAWLWMSVRNLSSYTPALKIILRNKEWRNFSDHVFCRHRHLPKPIYKATNLRRTMIEAENKKEAKRRAHSAPGSIKSQPFRKRRIIKEEEWVALSQEKHRYIWCISCMMQAGHFPKPPDKRENGDGSCLNHAHFVS